MHLNNDAFRASECKINVDNVIKMNVSRWAIPLLLLCVLVTEVALETEATNRLSISDINQAKSEIDPVDAKEQTTANNSDSLKQDRNHCPPEECARSLVRVPDRRLQRW
ncbi:unnamed protein product [Acanthoscelides obtectus]|uniref:Uncharacterized protein n=1 Tax=Acanthoscelides obtectus TaxID=200917 RepID=A0A9P0Q2M8_ACAOB|nr:unnamed protein product [Acanthoscelides obtectus]CAK1638564.1 hypothetical protein AOBTE_LOCUS10668 [Acanthoscelides obtectus]